jgi:Ca2+-binding RTX toxin-like protein
MSYVMPPDLMRIDSRGGWSALTSPMLYYIAAIQHLYGANMSYRAGNDVYAFGGAGSFCTAVWDAGGIDTFDFTGLRSPLDVSLVAGSTFAIPTTGGRSSTLSIAFNVTIENLIGGAGGDILSGNDAGNDITGAGGDDILTGGGGDDTLRGGEGADTARFWLVRSAYTLVDNADGSWSVTAASGGEGRDVLWGVEWLEFADGRVRLDPQPVAPAAPGAIMGTAGADRLSGGAGSDVAVSVNLAKTSRSTGDARGDTYSSIEAFAFGDGADAFIGGKVGDIALGGGGDDALSGGGGGDTLSGGDGNDILTGGAGRDLLTGGAGADRFVFASTGDLGDTIADYDAGDVLQFSSKAFGRPGALVTGETLIVSDDPVSAVSRKATFLFDTDTGVLSYDRDGTGKAGPVTVATLTGVTTLDVSDFVFV